MHVLFPRYFDLCDEEGNTLLRASSVWVLLNSETRRMAFPENYGVEIDGFDGGNGVSLPFGLKPFAPDTKSEFNVSFSRVDLNGHVNNAAYCDILEDALGAEFLKEHSLKSLFIFQTGNASGRARSPGALRKRRRSKAVGRDGERVLLQNRRFL